MQESNSIYQKEEYACVEAWFTDEIPISNGPGAFHGLPRLILKVETPQMIFLAQKIVFIDRVDINRPADSELIPQEKLMEKLMQATEQDRKKQVSKPGN